MVEFRAEVHMEPHSRYVILINNPLSQIQYKAVGESQYEHDSQEKYLLNNGESFNAIMLARHSATSPNFPFTVEIKTNDGSKVEFVAAMRIVTQDRFETVPVIYSNSAMK